MLLIGAAMLLNATTGLARDEAARFDIAAQPLSSALEAFSSASGYQILVSDPVPSTVTSVAIRGSYRPRDALLRMVEGSGLSARFTAEKAAILMQDPAARQHAARQKHDREQFDAALQIDVAHALCRNTLTRPGGYRAALDVWIAPDGRVSRAELLSSTGDIARDGQIVSTLRAQISIAPPTGLVQPTTLLLMPARAGAQDVCTQMVGDPE